MVTAAGSALPPTSRESLRGEMKMQPSLEEALAKKEILKA